MLRILLYIALLAAIFSACNREPIVREYNINLPDHHQNLYLVDSILIEMPLEEKLGQLILYQPHNNDNFQKDTLIKAINNYHIGGIQLSGFSLSAYLALSDTAKKLSKLPLLNATQADLSLHNHFSDLGTFPSLQTAAALDSMDLLRSLTKHYKKQQTALGINAFFCDNPDVYHLRDKLDHYHQKNHSVIPTLTAWMMPDSVMQMDSIEQRGKYFLKYQLQRETNFHGLISANIRSEKQLLKSLFAGADFIVTDKVYDTYQHLKNAWEQGVLSEFELNTKVRKILRSKNWVNKGGLLPTPPAPKALFVAKYAKRKKVKDSSNHGLATKIAAYFKDESWPFMAKLIYEKAIILANNHQSLLPYSSTYKRDFRIIQYSQQELKAFKKAFSKYAYYARFHYPPNDFGMLKSINVAAQQWSTPIFILDNLTLDSIDNQQFIKNINTLSKKAKTVVINFGTPQNLPLFEETVTTIQIFERNEITESLAAQLLFGGIKGTGKLPSAVSEFYDLHTSNPIKKTRLQHTIPEKVGIKKARLVGIDAIAKAAIQKQATPGCQVLVAKDGHIVYSKAFGYHTYKKHQYVNRSDLYDLASITKVASTTLSAMKLFEEGKIDIQAKLKTQLKLPATATVGNISLKNLFTHQSGLQAQMPINDFLSRKDSTHQLCTQYFCKENQDSFDIQVAENLFFKSTYLDTIWDKVYHLPVQGYSKYRYSDVNFNLIQKVVEQQSKTDIKDYSFSQFFQPLGLRKILYNPLEHHKKISIVPTEEDVKWRKELLQGYVHDETAALFGGVGGNAGLFANAEDLAVLFQMLLNGGQYGGKQYLKAETIDYFTDHTFSTHRGLGFDKPRKRRAPAYAKDASPDTYGHTGFTGTCVWVDPQHQLIFIFLSNRVHPNMWNKNLFREETRSRIHQIVYDAMDTFNFELPELDLGEDDKI